MLAWWVTVICILMSCPEWSILLTVLALWQNMTVSVGVVVNSNLHFNVLSVEFDTANSVTEYDC